MPQESNRVTLNTTSSTSSASPSPTCTSTTTRTTWRCASTPRRAGEALYESVGAIRTVRTPPYPATHNIGTARMSERPEDGVVNAFGQAHDMPNLFVSDASQFTTGAAANPTLTIVALAIRQAEYIVDQLKQDAIPTGHAVWNGRDPGGSIPEQRTTAAAAA